MINYQIDKDKYIYDKHSKKLFFYFNPAVGKVLNQVEWW